MKTFVPKNDRMRWIKEDAAIADQSLGDAPMAQKRNRVRRESVLTGDQVGKIANKINRKRATPRMKPVA